MNASKLTAEQMEWICRQPLAQLLEEAQQTKRSAKKHDVGIIYANATIEKISEIYKAIGYWQDTDKVGN